MCCYFKPTKSGIVHILYYIFLGLNNALILPYAQCRVAFGCQLQTALVALNRRRTRNTFNSRHIQTPHQLKVTKLRYVLFTVCVYLAHNNRVRELTSSALLVATCVGLCTEVVQYALFPSMVIFKKKLTGWVSLLLSVIFYKWYLFICILVSHLCIVIYLLCYIVLCLF